MTTEEIYQSIGEKLWSIMPQEAKKILFEGSIFDGVSYFQCRWIDEHGNRCNFDFDFHSEENDLLDELLFKIDKEVQELKKDVIFAENPWTHYRIYLSDAAEFSINFAYIPEEDSWPELYFKGISDLNEDEIDEYGIPTEIWEERVKHKKG